MAAAYDYSSEAKTWPGPIVSPGTGFEVKYPSGPFTWSNVVGGPDGDAFITTAQTKEVPGGGTSTWHMNGTMVETIEVWKDSEGITGLRVSYTDNYQTPTYGSSSGELKSFTFRKAKRVTAFSLWDNGKGTHTGRIKFATDNGIIS